MSRNGQFGQARAPQRRAPAEQDPYAAQGQWPQQPNGYPDPNYANGNGAYANGNGAQQGYPAQQGYHYPPQEPDPQYGYPQQPQGPAFYQGQPAQPQWGQQDPRNYDLGSYMPNGAQGYPHGEPAHFQHPQEPAPFAPAQQHGYAEPDADYDEELADGEDEPRSGRRWMLIVAALVGAIGLGGGLAYTYKMLFTNGSGRAPIVKAIDFPNKVKPATRGTENAQTDQKLFTRLGEDGPDARATQAGGSEAQEERAAESATGGPRPVRIIPILPGGQQQQQVSTTGSVGSGAGQLVNVPGLMIDTPSTNRAGLPQQQVTQPSVQVRGTAQQQQQQQQASEQAAPQKKAVAVLAPAKAPTAKVAVPKTSETGATASYTPVSNGYVAVLSSQKSRLDAMKAYASIDQKYRDMLASATFDVQEVDLGEKGVWYRAVVGPPRSFDGAKKICEELKAAGYPSCWPVRY